MKKKFTFHSDLPLQDSKPETIQQMNFNSPKGLIGPLNLKKINPEKKEEIPKDMTTEDTPKNDSLKQIDSIKQLDNIKKKDSLKPLLNNKKFIEDMKMIEPKPIETEEKQEKQEKIELESIDSDATDSDYEREKEMRRKRKERRNTTEVFSNDGLHKNETEEKDISFETAKEFQVFTLSHNFMKPNEEKPPYLIEPQITKIQSNKIKEITLEEDDEILNIDPKNDKPIDKESNTSQDDIIMGKPNEIFSEIQTQKNTPKNPPPQSQTDIAKKVTNIFNLGEMPQAGTDSNTTALPGNTVTFNTKDEIVQPADNDRISNLLKKLAIMDKQETESDRHQENSLDEINQEPERKESEPKQDDDDEKDDSPKRSPTKRRTYLKVFKEIGKTPAKQQQELVQDVLLLEESDPESFHSTSEEEDEDDGKQHSDSEEEDHNGYLSDIYPLEVIKPDFQDPEQAIQCADFIEVRNSESALIVRIMLFT